MKPIRKELEKALEGLIESKLQQEYQHKKVRENKVESGLGLPAKRERNVGQNQRNLEMIVFGIGGISDLGRAFLYVLPEEFHKSEKKGAVPKTKCSFQGFSLQSSDVA